MCLQCTVEAKVVKEFGRWTLMISNNDESSEWPKGWLGLVITNDPHFVFPISFTKDPYENKDDDYIESSTKEEWETFERHIEDAKNLDEKLQCSPNVGHLLISEMKKCGYDEEKEHIEFWLTNRFSEIDYR